MRSHTWKEVCRRRLTRHNLITPAPASEIVEVARAVCGLQAQIITAAELAISARVAGITQDDVREEMWERRSLVKTYGPRGTLHLLPADELPLWMAAMRARSLMTEPPWYEAAGLDAAQGEALIAAIGEALDGKCLTREELADEVASRAGEWAKAPLASTWGEMLPPATYMGLLCFGPSKGSKVTFVRADQWVDDWKEVDPQAALAEVLRRYLWAYGPATYQDFARWFWLKPEEARRLILSPESGLEEVNLEGHRAWVVAADSIASQAQEIPDGGSLRLLPQYDCYILGSGQRDRIVPESARQRIREYGRGRLEGAVGIPLLLIDGIVSGMWERHLRGTRIDVKVEPFVQLTPRQQRQLEAETVRVGQFLGAEIALSLGDLS